jgi:hypothetical protein
MAIQRIRVPVPEIISASLVQFVKTRLLSVMKSLYIICPLLDRHIDSAELNPTKTQRIIVQDLQSIAQMDAFINAAIPVSEARANKDIAVLQVSVARLLQHALFVVKFIPVSACNLTGDSSGTGGEYGA